MPDNTEIDELLNNMRKALKHYSVKELNEAIIFALSEKKEDISEPVKFVLKIVAKHYGISEKILKNSVSRGRIVEAKNISYCLLHYDLGLPTGYIANRIFFNWKNSVHLGTKKLKSLNLSIKADKDFYDTYQQMQTKLLIFITDKK
jgi:hypothetical protein